MVSLSDLLVACRDGNEADVRSILISNIDLVNAADKSSTSALIMAANMGYDNIVNLLLDFGADINFQGAGGVTPLHCAVAIGNSTVVSSLLQRAPKINLRNSAGKTPIQCARKTDIKRLLQEVIPAE